MSEIYLDKFNVSRPKALTLLVLTAVLWSFGGLLIKLVDLSPLAIAGMRSAIASLLLLFFIRKPSLSFSRSQIIGAFAYAGTVILFVSANKMTTAANAILLQYTAPVFVAIFGIWFLKEKVKLFDWVTIILVISGMFLFFLDDLSGGGLIGNLLALLSGLCFATMIVCLRSQKDASPILTVFWGNILTALIGLPFMFKAMPSVSSWIGLILLGVFQLGLSYIFYTIAIKKVTAIEAVLIPVIEPILNPIFVLIVMGEIPGPWSIAGGAIVLVAITARCVKAVIRPSGTETSVSG